MSPNNELVPYQNYRWRALLLQARTFIITRPYTESTHNEANQEHYDKSKDVMILLKYIMTSRIQEFELCNQEL